MNAPKIHNYKEGPEAKIQASIVAFLRLQGWFVMETHGNMYSMGWPDLYACHSVYQTRWIEVKNSESYSFTRAQLDTFPKMNAHGVGIWILTAGTEEEYRKLWAPQNWHIYLMLLNQRSANIPRINSELKIASSVKESTNGGVSI